MASDANFTRPLDGACRCGQLRYRVSKAPRFIMACHCTDCQALTSSAFSLGMVVPDDGFAQTGEARVWEKTGESGGWSRQFTCPHCAGWTHTCTEHAAGNTIVRPATLADHRWVRPIAQIYTRSALPWALLTVPLSYETVFPDPAPLAASFEASGIGPGA